MFAFLMKSTLQMSKEFMSTKKSILKWEWQNHSVLFNKKLFFIQYFLTICDNTLFSFMENRVQPF